jgi:hypothetical protein
MKKLATKVTAAESQFESSLQLVLVVFICLKDDEVTLTSLSAGLSSIMMIGKAAAENYLTFGRSNQMADLNLLGMLMILAKFLPVFVLTALFRVGTLAVVLKWSKAIMWSCVLPLVLIVPFLVLSLINLVTRNSTKPKLADLGVAELVQAVVGELTIMSLWGRRGREDSRWLQLQALASQPPAYQAPSWC